MSFRDRLVLLAGRVLLGGLFLAASAAKVADWTQTLGYLAVRNVPAPELFLAGAILLEAFGGLSLIFGWRARTGARALIAVLVPATLIFHNFWAAPMDDVREQALQFLKNTAILGGLLLVAGNGSGPWSLDGGN